VDCRTDSRISIGPRKFYSGIIEQLKDNLNIVLELDYPDNEGKTKRQSLKQVLNNKKVSKKFRNKAKKELREVSLNSHSFTVWNSFWVLKDIFPLRPGDILDWERLNSYGFAAWEVKAIYEMQQIYMRRSTNG
jgi:hypothetical protein